MIATTAQTQPEAWTEYCATVACFNQASPGSQIERASYAKMQDIELRFFRKESPTVLRRRVDREQGK